MKKITIILFLTFPILKQMGAQEKLFLSRKSEPLVYTVPDYTKGTVVKQLVSSASDDGKFLAIQTSEHKISGDGITPYTTGTLVDMETGKIIQTKNNYGFIFGANCLLKIYYGDLMGKSIKTSDIAAYTSNVKYYTANPKTGEIVQPIVFPEGENYYGSENGYLKFFNTTKSYNALYKVVDGQLKLIGKYLFSGVLTAISSDGKLIAGLLTSDKKKIQSTSIVVYDIISGALVNEFEFNKGAISICFINKNRLGISTFGQMDFSTLKTTQNLNIIDLSSNLLIKEIPDEGGHFEMDVKNSRLITIKSDGHIKFYETNSFSLIGEENAFHVNKKDFLGGFVNPVKIGSGNYYLLGHNSGISKLVDIEAMRVIADIYVDAEDWAIVAADGRVDGTPGAFEKLEWRKYNNADEVVEQIPLSLGFEKFFTVNLLTSLINGAVGSSNDILTAMNNAPKAKIVSPSNNAAIINKQIEVSVTATSNGDPIKEIQLFINGKLAGGSDRGFKSVGEIKTFTVYLAQGLNRISAKAISEKGYESEFDYIDLKYNGQIATANLYIFAVGVNKYMNSAYNLNYAVADVNAIVAKIQSKSSGIFKKTVANILLDEEAKRDAILNKLDEISAIIQPEDVFIFFYAGHGVLEEVSNDFYLALNDVTQLYGKTEILKSKGISSIELKDRFSKIKAQKQLIILDACQSGGAVNTFAMRGAVQEKVLVQLARSSGLVLLASTGSEQFATEFKELGHGVFTYALLEGLNGKADGGEKDLKITVKELEAYLNDYIPLLTEKYKGQPQFPRSWSSGQDFPIVITE